MCACTVTFPMYSILIDAYRRRKTNMLQLTLNPNVCTPLYLLHFYFDVLRNVQLFNVPRKGNNADEVRLSVNTHHHAPD